MHDLINLADLDDTWIIEAAYAHADTFLGRAIYPENKLFLQKPAAFRLKRVQGRLWEYKMRLKIWDAYRPFTLQKIMWEMVQDERYVAPPHRGSRHNRGCAVDVTLTDWQGNELSMPTSYDDFSVRAHRDYFHLPENVIKNRQFLEEIMKAEGFIPLHEEWWHFDAPEWEHYEVMDFNPYGIDYRYFMRSNQ